jgi:DNA helicase-2/ATP-dependent DNA helicase PcrA
MLYGHTTVNRASRFLREIPSELLIQKEAERPAYSQPAYRQPATYSFRQEAPAPKEVSLPDFKKGDMVRHDVFGNGLILSVLKMGNDAMLEIAFDQVGTKRLMARTAASRMKRLS